MPEQQQDDGLPKLAPEQFLAIRDLILSAAGALQGFKPGALEAVAQVIERDLKTEGALMISTVHRVRGERFAKAIRAADALRIAGRDLVSALDLVDPNEAPIIEGQFR